LTLAGVACRLRLPLSISKPQLAALSAKNDFTQISASSLCLHPGIGTVKGPQCPLSSDPTSETSVSRQTVHTPRPLVFSSATYLNFSVPPRAKPPSAPHTHHRHETPSAASSKVSISSEQGLWDRLARSIPAAAASSSGRLLDQQSLALVHHTPYPDFCSGSERDGSRQLQRRACSACAPSFFELPTDTCR